MVQFAARNQSTFRPLAIIAQLFYALTYGQESARNTKEVGNKWKSIRETNHMVFLATCGGKRSAFRSSDGSLTKIS